MWKWDEERRLRELQNERAWVGRAIACIGVLVLACGLYQWNATDHPKSDDSELPLAVANSWYEESQMIPSKELGNDPNWQVVIDGAISEQIMASTTSPEHNLVDSELARSIDAKFYVDEEDGPHEVEGYLESPILLVPDKYYVIEFNCAKYNTISPINSDTARYFIMPTRVVQNDISAVTFALYQPDQQRFHQVCVPFMSAEDMTIEYSQDQELALETNGQMYRLIFKTRQSQK